MKILLIDNNTEHKKALARALAGHDVEVQRYTPGVRFNYQDKDLVLLTGGGGEGHEIDDKHSPGRLWYEDEMKFIQVCNKPVIGICMGFEIIANTFGAKVDEMKKEVRGVKRLRTTKAGREYFKKDNLRQYEAHKWRVKELPEQLVPLAYSNDEVYAFKHRERPLYAFQFHPEVEKGVDGKAIFDNFVDKVVKPRIGVS